mmetsp:Transcript_63038/g.166801  ORF Transcript_63038/g.166801 Transcript_63038/m.166801 type:complete len:132 (+) Transcript_63038:969-1364(+)
MYSEPSKPMKSTTPLSRSCRMESAMVRWTLNPYGRRDVGRGSGKRRAELSSACMAEPKRLADFRASWLVVDQQVWRPSFEELLMLLRVCSRVGGRVRQLPLTTRRLASSLSQRAVRLSNSFSDSWKKSSAP